MSLLTPERVPVKVYKSTDTDAPQLDGSAGCMMTIFKACLVTGYGDKESAGWTMPFEGLTTGVTIFNTIGHANANFCLRLSGDDGNKINASLYSAMTDIDTGSDQLSLPVPFYYKKADTNAKWIMVVSDYGFWFNCKSMAGGYFFWVGALSSKLATSAAYGMLYSGGTWKDGDAEFKHGAESSGSSMARINEGGLIKIVPTSAFTSGLGRVSKFTADDFVPMYVVSTDMLQIPGIFLSLYPLQTSIFTPVVLDDGGSAVHLRLGNYQAGIAGAVVATDYWYY